jgi:hypothetical protein
LRLEIPVTVGYEAAASRVGTPVAVMGAERVGELLEALRTAHSQKNDVSGLRVMMMTVMGSYDMAGGRRWWWCM